MSKKEMILLITTIVLGSCVICLSISLGISNYRYKRVEEFISTENVIEILTNSSDWLEGFELEYYNWHSQPDYQLSLTTMGFLRVFIEEDSWADLSLKLEKIIPYIKGDIGIIDLE